MLPRIWQCEDPRLVGVAVGAAYDIGRAADPHGSMAVGFDATAWGTEWKLRVVLFALVATTAAVIAAGIVVGTLVGRRRLDRDKEGREWRPC